MARGRTRWPTVVAGAVLAVALGACAGGDQTGAVPAGTVGVGPAQEAPPPTDEPTDEPRGGSDGSDGSERSEGGADGDPDPGGSDAGSAARDAASDEVRRRARFTMPDLVGRGLQDAQDRLQARGSYLLDQVDASGRGRLLLDDRNWRVCDQRPARGTRTAVTTVVRLEAVKRGERCP